MKKIIIMCLCCFTLTANAAVDIKQQDAVATEPNQTIMVSADDPTVEILLDSNPTTGYSWYIETYPSDQVARITSHFITSDPKKVGSGGMQKWIFTLDDDVFEAPHKLTFKFVYARSWQIDKPAKEETFYVATSGK